MNLYVTDENECLNSNGGCTQECVNIPGSSVCKCVTGYAVDNTDNTKCVGKFVTLEILQFSV